eukprot:358087-Chlamydomonas_euryale.AAC.1
MYATVTLPFVFDLAAPLHALWPCGQGADLRVQRRTWSSSYCLLCGYRKTGLRRCDAHASPPLAQPLTWAGLAHGVAQDPSTWSFVTGHPRGPGLVPSRGGEACGTLGSCAASDAQPPLVHAESSTACSMYLAAQQSMVRSLQDKLWLRL